MLFDAHAVTLSPTEQFLLDLFIVSVAICALIFTNNKNNSSNPGLIFTILVVLAISGRLLLNPIPNVQPVTFLIIMIGIYFGISYSIAFAAIVTMSSNVMLEHGLWSNYQIFAWALIGVLAALFRTQFIQDEKLNITRLAIFAGFSGFLFDWIVSLSILHSVDTSFFLIYLLNGLPFDLLHAAGNIVLVAWFANPLSELMTRQTSLINPEAVSELVSN
jgi:energy-coupling factor transport system substrate-specific component|tara:strand:- start:1141 stop:1794 length:654 start_codon:yes stop_codon:yes gene_type:complete